MLPRVVVNVETLPPPEQQATRISNSKLGIINNKEQQPWAKTQKTVAAPIATEKLTKGATCHIDDDANENNTSSQN